MQPSFMQLENQILALLPQDNEIKVLIPKREFGDLACNFPMVMAKKNRTNPLAIFDQYKDKIAAIDYIDAVEFVAGFCNLRLKENFFTDIAPLSETDLTHIGAGKKVNIEYISANPTGNLHLGHLRGFYGDVLANVLDFVGYKVTRESYVNDLGNQVEVLGRSVIYAVSKLKNHLIEKPKECYESKEIDEIASILQNETDPIYCGQKAIEYMLECIKKQLEYIGIHFDVWRSESEIKNEGLIDTAIDILEKAGLIQTGTLGEVIAKRGGASNQEIKIFKGKKAVTKSNGTHSYFGADLGYLYDKVNRGFDWIIYCIGAEQAENFESLKEVAPYFGYKGKISVISFQTIDMLKDGERKKFSKRGGCIIRPTDLNLPTPDALRIAILSKRNDTHFSINLDEIERISEKNLLYFILNPLQKIKTLSPNTQGEDFFSPRMLDLAHLLSQFSHKIIQSINAVNILVDYAIEISRKIDAMLDNDKLVDIGVGNRAKLLKDAIYAIDKILSLLGVTAEQNIEVIKNLYSHCYI